MDLRTDCEECTTEISRECLERAILIRAVMVTLKNEEEARQNNVYSQTMIDMRVGRGEVRKICLAGKTQRSYIQHLVENGHSWWLQKQKVE